MSVFARPTKTLVCLSLLSPPFLLFFSWDQGWWCRWHQRSWKLLWELISTSLSPWPYLSACDQSCLKFPSTPPTPTTVLFALNLWMEWWRAERFLLLFSARLKPSLTASLSLKVCYCRQILTSSILWSSHADSCLLLTAFRPSCLSFWQDCRLSLFFCE